MQHRNGSVIQLLQTACFDVITKCWEAAELLRGVSGMEKCSVGLPRVTECSSMPFTPITFFANLSD